MAGSWRKAPKHAGYGATPRPRPRLPQTPRAAAAPAADYAPQPGLASEGDALLGASQALARLLDAAAAAIAASSSHVPALVQGVLARLFPAASSISAALPSPGGRARGRWAQHCRGWAQAGAASPPVHVRLAELPPGSHAWIPPPPAPACTPPAQAPRPLLPRRRLLQTGGPWQ